MEYFVTIKIAWNNFNKFPNHTFYWKGIDGSQLFCHFPPADTYLSDGSLGDIASTVTNHRDKGRANCSMLLFGDGDGGGGPQYEHIERISRLEDLDGIPKVKFGTFDNFFDEACRTQNKLMTWEGELYLEGHNGTFTSMAEHKFYNRTMETLLRDTEYLYYFARLLEPENFKPSFSHDDIREMWYTFLIDQFHDVLPGTCTKLTVDDTRQNFKELKEKCSTIVQQSLSSLLQVDSESLSV